MKFMLLIYDRANYWQTTTTEEQAAALEKHEEFGAFLRSRGSAHSGEALYDAREGATVRQAASGKFDLVDGPFIGLKEDLGGFYIIEAASLDDAVEVAKRCPADFAVEVRPVMDFSDS